MISLGAEGDFEQHCEGGTAALFGSIRINAGPVAERCRSDVTSFSELKALVLASNSSPASKKSLINSYTSRLRARR